MKYTLLTIILFECLCLNAQPVVKNFSFNKGGVPGGEVQSCVLYRPKRNGADSIRVLFSSDIYFLNKITKNFIFYYDIPSNSRMVSLTKKISKISLKDVDSNYFFGTNDHDLIKLPNGDIIFAVGAFSKKDVKNKPGWWKETYRNSFGPGARYVVLFWKSSDGGQSFSYQGEYDPLITGPFFAAAPQFRRNGNQFILKPNWDMGGSDGQVTTVLTGEGNKIYISYGVVGYDGSLNADNKYILDNTKKYNKTVLVSSDDEGKTWTANEESIDIFKWRGDLVGFKNSNTKNIAMVTQSGVITGISPLNQNKYSFSKTSSSPGNISGWGELTSKVNKIDSSKTINNFFYTNIWSYPVIANCPGKQEYLVAFPSLVENKRALRVYLFNPANDSYLEMDPVLPATDSTKDMVGSTIIHPVMIKSDGGPVLLYWTDIDENTLKYAIKGRVIYNDKEYSDDFIINDYTDLPNWNLWIGDYNTGGSVTKIEKVKSIVNPLLVSEMRKTSFYPIWFKGGSLFFF